MKFCKQCKIFMIKKYDWYDGVKKKCWQCPNCLKYNKKWYVI